MGFKENFEILVTFLRKIDGFTKMRWFFIALYIFFIILVFWVLVYLYHYRADLLEHPCEMCFEMVKDKLYIPK